MGAESFQSLGASSALKNVSVKEPEVLAAERNWLGSEPIELLSPR
jgi:hypothetical protein